MIISTSRLTLRPLQRSDIDAMARWPRYPDPLDAIWNWPHTLREHGTTDMFFLARTSDHRRREWTITTTDGAVVGHLGLRDIQPGQKSARLGIGMGYPYIGIGYGSEALRAFLDAFFGPLAFARLHLDVSLHNQRALRLYQRLGFRETGTFWYELGAAAEFAFLADPRYESLRQYLRWSVESVCMRYAEMVLDASDWQSVEQRRPEGTRNSEQ
ncbi:MAG TPA: GNAT family N-acetyltransferase [Herpetosiphonaceae bacterium]